MRSTIGCVLALARTETRKFGELGRDRRVRMADMSKPGHYQRMRERFLAGAPESRTDAALLELLLTYAIGRRDVRPVAESLLQTFGSLDGVLAASCDELCKAKGVGEASAALLKAIEFLRDRPRAVRANPAAAKKKTPDGPLLFDDLASPAAQATEPPKPERPPGCSPRQSGRAGDTAALRTL